MRQRPDEQIGLLTPAPGFWRIGQFQPVPLGFITRWMRNDGIRALGGGAAGLTHRAQIPGPDVAGQALIRQPKPQALEFVEQGAGPQMRILHQARRHIVDERVKRIRRRPGTHPRLLFTIQVLADRLTVEPGVAGDRRDRPTTFAQSMYFHIVLPCEHEKAGLLKRSYWR
jgi:hypothetical protein